MTQTLYTRTNQKLYFAGLSLKTWRAAEEGTAPNRLAIIQAEREATLFHLYGALLGLCHEIIGYYRFPLQTAKCVTEVLNEKVLQQSPGPELSELMELLGDSGSWLSLLLSAYNRLFLPLPPDKPARIQREETLIGSMDITDDILQPSDEMLEDWCDALKKLTLRFRQLMMEI